MDLYPLLVFLHVVGGMGFVAAVVIEVLVVTRLGRAATLDQAQTLLGLMRVQGRVVPAAMSTVLITGIWMMIVRWGPVAWATVAFAGLIILIATGVTLTRRAMTNVGTSLAGASHDLPERFQAAVTSKALTVSLASRGLITLAIVALMTLKPGVVGSLTILAAALVIGFGTAMLPGRQKTPMTA
jgi:hypothetical protein